MKVKKCILLSMMDHYQSHLELNVESPPQIIKSIPNALVEAGIAQSVL
jgi:hypothetical protein